MPPRIWLSKPPRCPIQPKLTACCRFNGGNSSIRLPRSATASRNWNSDWLRCRTRSIHNLLSPMNENDSIPMPAMSEPNPIQEQAAEGELTFEWHRNEFGSKRDEYGDREVVDTAYQATAIIIEPEPDKVVQEQRQSVVRWRQEYQGKNYVVFKRAARSE